MVRKTFWAGIVVSAMMVVTVGAASAAPPTMSISSWESTVVDGTIVGGTRTVVVSNITDSPMIGHTINLGEVPCNCELTDVSSGQTITGNSWVIPELALGESATVTLRYESATHRVPAATSNSFLGLVAVIAAMMVFSQDGLWPDNRGWYSTLGPSRNWLGDGGSRSDCLPVSEPQKADTDHQ